MKHFLTNQLVPSRALCCPILAAIVSLTILSASRTNAAGVLVTHSQPKMTQSLQVTFWNMMRQLPI